MNSIHIASYLLYLSVILVVTIHVGWQLYTHGEVYLLKIFEKSQHLVQPINKMLLLGYYLVNIGFAIYSISQWEKMFNLAQMLGYVSERVAYIVLTLSVMHYMNMLSFYIYQAIEKKNQVNNKINS